MAPAPSGQLSARRRGLRAWWWFPYVLVTPIIAFEGLFVIWPIIKGILTAFKSQKLGKTGQWTTSNFSQMFSDKVFWNVVVTTLEFTAVVLVAVLVVGLLIALLLNWSFRGRTFVWGVLALPWGLPDIPTVLTFLLMMDPNFGVFNRIVGWFGLHHVAWLTDPHWAFLAVVMIVVWKGFPFYALITLSALQAVPDDLIEAAKVDGAGAVRRFRSVILPAIRPTLALLAVLAFIYSLQQFALIYLTTGGGPGNRTTTLSLLVYNEAFQFFNYSYASAIAVVGLLFSVIGTGLFIVIERQMSRSR